MYYKCVDCGYVTAELNFIGQDHPYGETYATEEFGVCPVCGGDVEEASECHVCGEYHTGEYDLCPECIAERMTFKDIKKYADDKKFPDLEVKVPNIVYHLLSEEVMEDVLLEHLKDNFDYCIEKAIGYLTEDMEDFCEWVKKQ